MFEVAEGEADQREGFAICEESCCWCLCGLVLGGGAEGGDNEEEEAMEVSR